MNMQSVAHSSIKNQESSWTDDPFSLKGQFKGVVNINHKRNLSQFAEELAYQFGQFDGHQYSINLLDLSEFDQNELARLYMELTGRETSECVNGADFSTDNEFTCALLAMLQDDCKETRNAFAEVTRKNIITYYSEPLQHILDEACHDLLCSLNNDNSNYSYQDKDSGEILWRKF